ncbi:hypothetical protein F4802DRAFT_113713 [Xylaria palmicola]|nr:hypothetical protein F4802DRAFT_113713 [Xylaria palmicola]
MNGRYSTPLLLGSPGSSDILFIFGLRASKMSVFTKFLVLGLLPTALGSPVTLGSSENPINERDNSFVWGSVGDSWASGVSYSTTQHTDYDDDKYGCHRWKDSYGPIMERDTTWTTGAQTFHFAACMFTSPSVV